MRVHLFTGPPLPRLAAWLPGCFDREVGISAEPFAGQQNTNPTSSTPSRRTNKATLSGWMMTAQQVGMRLLPVLAR